MRFITASPLLLTALLIGACDKPGSEFLEALPDRQTLEVNMPAGAQTTGQGLSSAEIGTAHSALVGGPASYYTLSYYHSRAVNQLGRFVLRTLERITARPPTTVGLERAVWGPLSGPGEPNEFRLTIELVETGTAAVYAWWVEGKHKSTDDSAYATLAGGAFEPQNAPRGRGWFGIDFDAIGQLDPSEGGSGRIAYAYQKNEDGVLVFARADDVDAAGQARTMSYSYGRNAAGGGFMLFAVQEDIYAGLVPGASNAREDLVLVTRWRPTGPGRTDVAAANGDFGASVATSSQCWDDRFMSTYEVTRLDGQVIEEDGDAATCTFGAARHPTAEELPSPEDLVNPHG